jgi:hypothetical protein
VQLLEEASVLLGVARSSIHCRSSEILAGYGIVGKRTATQHFSETFCRQAMERGVGNVRAM